MIEIKITICLSLKKKWDFSLEISIRIWITVAIHDVAFSKQNWTNFHYYPVSCCFFLFSIEFARNTICIDYRWFIMFIYLRPWLKINIFSAFVFPSVPPCFIWICKNKICKIIHIVRVQMPNMKIKWKTKRKFSVFSSLFFLCSILKSLIIFSILEPSTLYVSLFAWFETTRCEETSQGEREDERDHTKWME